MYALIFSYRDKRLAFNRSDVSYELPNNRSPQRLVTFVTNEWFLTGTTSHMNCQINVSKSNISRRGLVTITKIERFASHWCDVSYELSHNSYCFAKTLQLLLSGQTYELPNSRFSKTFGCNRDLQS